MVHHTLSVAVACFKRSYLLNLVSLVVRILFWATTASLPLIKIVVSSLNQDCTDVDISVSFCQQRVLLTVA